jgi:hypothetical protein
MAGWVSIVGSVFVVVGVWDVIANLRSLDTRQQVEKMLSESPMKGTGIGVDDWLSIMHTVSLVAAGCATAAAILGWHVLKRSRGARIGLTVVAVPLFLTGLFAGAFLSSMVAVSAALLWTKPSRDWFNGIAAQPSPRAPAAPPPPRQTMPPPSGPSYPLPPPPGWTEAPDAPLPAPPADRPQNPAPLATVAQRPAFTTARPAELRQACLVTWVCAGLVLTGSAMVVLALVVDPGMARDVYEQDSRIAEAGLTPGNLRSTFIVVCSVLAAWSLVAIGLAVAAYLGRNWARIALVASAGLAGLCFLLAALSSPVLVIPGLACWAVAFLLLRPQVHHWFTDRF